MHRHRENGFSLSVARTRDAGAAIAPPNKTETIVPKPKRDYPGRLTLDQWRALPSAKRHDLAMRAQCDVLGSFRYCTNKKCRRARSCSSGDPIACRQRLWNTVKKKPKTLRDICAKLAMLPQA
jgi:hypothetical protein